jgi:hypothetical protein
MVHTLLTSTTDTGEKPASCFSQLQTPEKKTVPNHHVMMATEWGVKLHALM